MRKRIITFGLGVAAAVFVAAPSVHAQRWEFGGGGGGSFYNSQTITAGTGSVDAGFNTGFAGTAYLAQVGKRFGGEIRYTYLKNDMHLNGAGANFNFSGYSQAIHYDFDVFTGKQGDKVRGFVAAGGGGKVYSGSGPDMAVQPLSGIAVLTRTSQWEPMVSFGGGVRFQPSEHLVVRAEVKVYATPAPTEVITPVGSSKLSGWYFNYVPLVSLAYTW
jgi:hypothetical protein